MTVFLVALIAHSILTVRSLDSLPKNSSTVICDGTFNIDSNSDFVIGNGSNSCFPKFVTSSATIRFEVVHPTHLIFYLRHLRIYDGIDDKSPVLWDITYPAQWFDLSSTNTISILYEPDVYVDYKPVKINLIGIKRSLNYHLTSHDYDLYINSSSIPAVVIDWTKEYNKKMYCLWILDSSNWKVQYPYMRSIQIFDTDQSGCRFFVQDSPLCLPKGKFMEETAMFTDQKIVIKYIIDPLKPLNFSYYISFYSNLVHTDCEGNGFHCRNGRCIEKSLLCNGRNNCGNKQDEDDYTCKSNTAEDDSSITIPSPKINILNALVFMLCIVVAFLLYQNINSHIKSTKPVHYSNNCISIDP